MVNSPAAHGKRWFNSTCQSHDLLEAILAGQIKQGGHSDSYTKKKLSQRFAKLSDGTIVQRDLYSAFLLLHLRKNLQSYSKKTIKKDFPQFKRLHDETKERLKNSHDWLPSSVGF